MSKRCISQLAAFLFHSLTLFFNSQACIVTPLPPILFHPSSFPLFTLLVQRLFVLCSVAVNSGQEEDDQEKCRGSAISCVFALKGSSRLCGITLSWHVMPSLLLLLPALLVRSGGWGVGLLSYLYSHPLSKKRNYYLYFTC